MRRGERWLPGVLAAVVVAAYLPSVWSGFVYDDFEVILAQAPARSVGDVARIFLEPHGLPQSQLPYYRPTTRASLLVQKAWHGEEPALFHLGNALLAGAVALAAWALLCAPRFGLPKPAAALAAAAFAVHPVASACVHPIASGRETLMPAIFMLASVAAYLRGGGRARALAVACFALALASKEQAVVVPVLWALADALRLPPDAPPLRVRAWKPWLARLGPAVLVLAGYLLLRGAIFPPAEGGISEAVAAQWALDPLGPLRSLGFALQVVLAPFEEVVYEPALSVWLSWPRLGAALVGLVLLLAAATRLPRADRAPAAFWLAWVPIGMALTLNWLPQETPYAERFVFFSSLGFIALAATCAARLVTGERSRRAALAVAVGVVGLLASLSVGRTAHYRDGLAFAAQWARTSPQTANARYSLGTALARAGRREEAVPELRRAVELAPEYANAHYNLAVVLAETGRRPEAMGSFRAALELEPGNADAQFALGVLLAESGRREEAERRLREAIRLAPGWTDPVRVLELLSAPR